MKTNHWLNENRILSHLRTFFCAIAILGVPLAFPSSAADRAARATGTPEPASGEFHPCFSIPTSYRQVGENLIITFDVTGWTNGTLVGSAVGTEMDVVHPDGSITLHGSLVFTGSISGSPEGTLVVTYEGIGNLFTGHETLRAIGRQGTGGLAGVYVNITAEGDVGAPEPGCYASGVGTYTGQILFTP